MTSSMFALLPLLAACADPSAAGGTVLVLDGPGFFDRPWPSDERTRAGRLDLDGFPQAGTNGLIDLYLAAGEGLRGFGTNSPIYVRFEAPIDLADLPSPADSTRLDSPVLLLDVDRASPRRGEAVPVAFEFFAEDGRWQPENLLAVAPVFGFPLRPATTYALVLRPPLARPTGQRAWGIDGDPHYAGTEETLTGLGIDPATVAHATVFTTQDPTEELRVIADTLHDRMAPPPFDAEVTRYAERSGYVAYEGEVLLPVWQHGARPYRDSAGGFQFDADGVPIVAAWERARFALSVPEGEPPADGWPVVLYGHGTGGDYTTFCNSGANEEEASVLSRVGVAMIGVSQPLHADRGTPDTNVDLDSFNFFNPEAGRTNFRQGALDAVWLARMLTVAPPRFVAEDGREIRLDPERVAYFGHSQGGLTGALAAPFFRDTVGPVGFSGTGGGLSITIVQRKDPLDIAALIETLFNFDEGETLTTFHPVNGLIQTIVEATDPLNYAAWVNAEAPAWSAVPHPLFLTEGLHDEATPPDATEAYAAAARLPIVGEPSTDPVALALRGLAPEALPVSANRRDWAGEAVTVGLAQFPDDGHFAIYDNNDARRMYRSFLASGLEGEPVIDE